MLCITEGKLKINDKHLLDYLQFDSSLVYSKAEMSDLIPQKDLGFFFPKYFQVKMIFSPVLYSSIQEQ